MALAEITSDPVEFGTLKCEQVLVASASSSSRKAGLNNYTLGVALLASTNSILLGYDIGVMSGAKLFIKEDLQITNFQQDILMGSLNVCSLIGTLTSGKTSDWIGRRYTIVVAAFTFLVGALFMGLAPSFAFLMTGRVIAGIGMGYSLMIAPVYATEISPTSTRGFLSSLPEVFINVGILLGYVINYALNDLPENVNWRLMLGIAAIPAVGILLGALVMPESPRWLIMKGRKEAARRVLVSTSDGGEDEADSRLAEILLAAATTVSNDWHGEGVLRDLILKPTRVVRRILIVAIGLNFFMQASGNDAVVYYCPEVFKSAGLHTTKQLFHVNMIIGVLRDLILKPTRVVRRILIVAIGLNFFMQASGNDAVVYYCPEVFKSAGLHTTKQLFHVNMIMGLAKTSFVLISALFLDRFGRRPLLLLGSTGMAVSLTGLGLGSLFLERSVRKPIWAIVLCVVAVCADVSFFSIGLGPITWVYSSEIFPLRFRAQGSSIAISVNRLVSGVVTLSFLPISDKITFGGTFFVLAGISGMATLFFYMFLPETKGQNLENIEELF